MWRNLLFACLRLLGRGVLAILRLLWQAFARILLGASDGVATLLRRTAPWAIGGVILYAVYLNNPEALGAILNLGIVIAIVIIGLKVMLGGFKKGGKRK